MIWSSRAPKTVGSNASTAAFAEAESAPFAFCGLEALDSELDESPFASCGLEALDAASAEAALCSLLSLPWRFSFFSSPSEPEAASLAELLWLDELELRTDELEELRKDELASSGAFVEACALGAPSLVSLAELLCTDFSSDVCGGELLAGGAEDTATELTLPQASESDIVAATTARGNGLQLGPLLLRMATGYDG